MAVDLKALLKKTKLLQPNEVEDQTCHVCCDDYLKDLSQELPRRLPCGHIIGTECLLQWASSQAHATAINCPWCMRPIIKSMPAQVNQPAQIIQPPMPAHAETAFERIVAPLLKGIHDDARELTTEHLLGVLTLVFVLLLPAMYSHNLLTVPPSAGLCYYMECVIQCRLEARPYGGMLSIIYGLCVETFVDTYISRDFLCLGKATVYYTMMEARAKHGRLRFLVVLAVFVAQAALGHVASTMIAIEAIAILISVLTSVLRLVFSSRAQG